MSTPTITDNKEQLKEILKLHQMWLADGKEGVRADLSGANLRWANLSQAKLFWANLSRANLCWANLSRANLSGANLYEASLFEANLSEANLFQADLYHTNLCWANLSQANLSGAKLPAPAMVLLASWGKLSPELTKKAMAYDAAHHDNPEAFTIWANGGECPYAGKLYQRACNFREKKDLWDPTVPCPRGFDLMVEIIREKCANSDWH